MVNVINKKTVESDKCHEKKARVEQGGRLSVWRGEAECPGS